jgi:hypothetical protein
MKRAAFHGAILLLAAWPAGVAGADRSTEPPTPARAVLGVEFAGTSVFDRSAVTPGRGDPGSTDSSNAAIRAGVTIAGEHRVADRWWLAGTLGGSQWIGGVGVDAGYIYRRLDLGVAPRFLIHRWSGWLVATALELAAPIGLSKPFVTVPQRRAFSEQVDSSWGWYAGGTVDVTVLFHVSQTPHMPSLGVRASVGYVRHESHRRTTFTPTDAGQAPLIDETDIVDQDLLFTLAAVLAF